MSRIEYIALADESGNDPKLSHFVHAGYLATVESWRSLEANWSTCLAEWGIRAFHMSEAEALDHEFATWDPARKNERVMRLAGLVAQHTTMGLACNMKSSGWRKRLERSQLALAKR